MGHFRPGRLAAQRGPRAAARAAVGLFVLVAVSLLGASSASAAGDPTVDRYIITNPVPGWSAAPAVVTLTLSQAIASELTTMTHEKVTVAFNDWAPDGSPDALLVMLVRFSGSIPSTVFGNVDRVATDGCFDATNNAGAVAQALPAIPTSAVAFCQGATNVGASPVTVVTFLQANVVAFVEGAGLASNKVSQVAQQESVKIPASGIAESSGLPATAILLGAAGLVLVAVVVVFVVRNSRKPRATLSLAGGLGTVGSAYPPGAYPPGAYPPARPFGQAVPQELTSVGWHPVDGNQYRLAYWDGSNWTSRKRWDGSSWLDEPQ